MASSTGIARTAAPICTFAYPEECGLRCHYHGWLFDETGKCIEQPFDDTVDPKSTYKDKTPIKAYPVEAKAGLLWAYMGPQPVPLVPDWEPFNWKNGFVQIVFSTIPCNWFQCQENSIDPVHFEWMHANWSMRLKGKRGPYGAKHLKVGFDEFEYGYVYRRIREDTDENNPLWSVGRVCLWPNCLFTGGHFEWRVPVDDETTLSVGWFFNRVPKDREPYVQNSIPHWYGPVTDAKGDWLTGGVMNQDFAAWVGQGADRRSQPGASRAQRSRHRHDPQPLLRGHRDHRQRRRSESSRARSKRSISRCRCRSSARSNSSKASPASN